MKKKFTLTLDEMKILESVYGKQFQNHASYNPRGIEKILELSAQEEKFFANNSFLSPHFSVQTLYKVAGALTPIKFNHIVRDLIKDNPAFRTNFCNVGSRTLKIIRPPIFFNPEITFHNLTKIDAANLDSELEKILEEIMSVNFDLRNDSLIRFMVCNTGIKEYAVMITTSLLIADRFNSAKFFAELFEQPAIIEHKNFSDNFPPVNRDLIHQHLTKLLYNPPPRYVYLIPRITARYTFKRFFVQKFPKRY